MTLVEIISVFVCFFKIHSSLVFQNRGAGLARNRLCGRPKEGGRNTKAKLAIKRKSRLKNFPSLRQSPLEFDMRFLKNRGTGFFGGLGGELKKNQIP